ncbi:UNVERIFIED_CONTAM: hypothetical protein H355_007904 [Colinus virginianus]|nr:hypothetical protein H355_007904 [Colinus virginianus]
MSFPPQTPNENKTVINESWNLVALIGMVSVYLKEHRLICCEEKTALGTEIMGVTSGAISILLLQLKIFCLHYGISHIILLNYVLNRRLTSIIFYSAGSFVLPGEVEEIVTCHTPAFEKPVQQKFRTSSVQQPLNNKAQELLGDDVQPFLLDEEFDYDNVALTPKFSEADLMAMKELSEEKKTGQMLSPAGAEV